MSYEDKMLAYEAASEMKKFFDKAAPIVAVVFGILLLICIIILIVKWDKNSDKNGKFIGSLIGPAILFVISAWYAWG